MKVVVTGGAGFIGSHVTDNLLRHGHDVLAIDDLSTGHARNLESALAHGRCELLVADAASEEARRAVLSFRPEVVALLAAQASVKVSMRDPVRDARENVLGLVTMVEWACEAGARKVVFATSGGTIYGEVAAQSLPVVESAYSAPTSPTSFYGLTKRVGVEYLRLYREHRGLDHVALALGNVYGARQDPNGEAGVVAIFLDRLSRGLPCVINGVGDTTRDYVHVDDVARAFRHATERGSGLINIGTGRETSTRQVHATLARHFPDAPRPEHGPALPGEISRVSLDGRRARDLLGWTPRTGFADGVARLVRDPEGVGIG